MPGGYQKATNNFENISTGELSELFGQPEENYFDYFVFNIVDYDVNCDLLRSEAHRHTLT
jgi:hypothetical protein